MSPDEGELSEDLRLKLRKKVLSSTYHFAKIVLGYNEIDPEPHGVLAEFLDDSNQLRKLLLAPRDTVKSWMVRAYVMRRICENPNIRVLYVMASDKNCKTPSRHFDNMFKQNKMLKWLFPEIVHSNFSDRSADWNITTKTVPRESHAGEATLTFAGVGSNLVGQHFDKIILDDVVDEEAAQSKTVMDFRIEWVGRCEPLLNSNNPEAEIVVVGTRWHLRDVYSVLMAEMERSEARCFMTSTGYAVMKRKAIERGKLYWGKVLSMEKLTALKARFDALGDPSSFYLQYMNDPLNEQLCEFPIHMVRYWNFTPSGDSIILEMPDGPNAVVKLASLRYTMTVDPAFGESRRHDESAISIIGSHPKGWRVLIHCWTGRVKVDILKNMIINLCIRFQALKAPIAKVGIEMVAGQRALIPYVRETARYQYNMHIDISEDMKRSTRVEKDNFIRGFVQVVAGGYYYTHRQFVEQNAQMDAFPQGRKDHLDSLAMQPQLWTTLSPEETEGDVDDFWFDEEAVVGGGRKWGGYGSTPSS